GNIDVDQVTRYTGDSVDGGSSLKIATLANSANNTNGKYWRHVINPAWNTGNHTPGSIEPDGIRNQPVWIQYRMKVPASRLVPPNGETVGHSSTGWKSFIFAN